MSSRRARGGTARFLGIHAIFLAAILGISLGALGNVAPGDEAPDFVLQDTSGNERSLAGLRGKTVILVFWKAEQERSSQVLAVLQSIYAECQEEGVEVLALSSDDGGPDTIRTIEQEKQLTFPMLYDGEKKVYGDYGVSVTPSTIIIDKEGKLNYYYPGHRDDFGRQISGHVDVLLGKKTLEELQAELQPVERPEVSDTEKKVKRYLSAGNRLLEKGMARSAMLQYEKAVQEDSTLFEAHLHLGNIYLEQEKVQESATAFTRAIQLKPRSDEAYAGLGDALFFQGQPEEAMEMLQTALKLNANLARAHYRLGRIYEEQERIEDALREYKIALTISLDIEE